MPSCPHCGSPSLGNPCWYDLKHPGYSASGADAPCAGDLYDIGQRALAKDRRLGCGSALVFLALVLVGSLLAAFLKDQIRF